MSKLKTCTHMCSMHTMQLTSGSRHSCCLRAELRPDVGLPTARNPGPYCAGGLKVWKLSR